MVTYVGSKASSKHPVVLTTHLDPRLSRWRSLVKWFLAIPQDLLHAVLWPAYLVVTVITGLCILFTDRYPRPLFDFTSGVLRWSWPVSYCAAHGGPGTGQYPTFRPHQGESEPTLPPQPPMVDPAIPPAPDPAGTRSVL
jgi:hypothetical protein